MHEPQEAYVLHVRNFSDSKVLIEFLTRSLGRIKVIARSPPKKERWQFQAFQPLEITVRGESELKTLVHSEALPNRLSCLELKGQSLFCAMYINELVQRLTSIEESEPTLFATYEAALETLAAVELPPLREAVLRNFELGLLSVLGYQINFLETANVAAPIQVESFYRFDGLSGFTEIFDRTDRWALKGQAILAVGTRDFSQPETLFAAKRITRSALRPLLGARPLKSRELFR